LKSDYVADIVFDEEDDSIHMKEISESETNSGNISNEKDSNMVISPKQEDEEKENISPLVSQSFQSPSSCNDNSSSAKKKLGYSVDPISFDQPIQYLRIPVSDSYETDIAKYFDQVATFIKDALATSKVNSSNVMDIAPCRRSCLVHCREARSRSVTLLIAYGMKELNMTLKQAVNNITRKTYGRPRINDGFKRQLMKYELQLMQERLLNQETTPKLQNQSNDQISNVLVTEDMNLELVNTYDFFGQRKDWKRERTYIFESSEDESHLDGDYVEQPSSKRRRKSKRRKLSPVSASILKYFAPIDMF
jgi:protein-tyrosine phosphatase